MGLFGSSATYIGTGVVLDEIVGRNGHLLAEPEDCNVFGRHKRRLLGERGREYVGLETQSVIRHYYCVI